MDRYQITSLDADGKVVADKVTEQSWCISELKLYFDEMATDLYTGKVDNIVITRVEK